MLCNRQLGFHTRKKFVSSFLEPEKVMWNISEGGPSKEVHNGIGTTGSCSGVV